MVIFIFCSQILTLSFSGIKRYFCIFLSTVLYFEFIETFTGFFKAARWSFFTLAVIVALKSEVCLQEGFSKILETISEKIQKNFQKIFSQNFDTILSLGMALKILSISCSKSMFKILSASSMTKNFKALRLKPRVFSK